ncbi:hypothetical protein J6590_034644 [Homalodisca vitripennis]|nr:hypothetical protein J6590_034644 [Homalodisca vitripennis]
MHRVQRLSQDKHIKQRRAWLLLGWVSAERSCPCKHPAYPAIDGGSEVFFNPLAPRLSVREGFLALTSPGMYVFDMKTISVSGRGLHRDVYP